MARALTEEASGARVATGRGAGGRVLRAVGAGLAGGVAVLAAVASLVFVVVRLIPGDPALAALGGPGSQASPEALAEVRSELGLDRPVLEQYARTLGRLAIGDWGDSVAQRRPVLAILGEQLPSTLALAAAALALAWALALGLTLAAAVWPRRARPVLDAIGVVSASLPHFWLGTVLIAVFALGLGWLPPVSTPGPAGLLLPALTLAIPLGGYLAQVMADSLADADASGFAFSARTRGESARGVLLRHTLRHGAIPAVALSGWAAGSLISGAVVVEQIFARPGLGRTLLAAVTQRDAPVILGVTVATAAVYVALTVAGDAVARGLDPRGRENR